MSPTAARELPPPPAAGGEAEKLLGRLLDFASFDFGCLFLEDDKGGVLRLEGSLEADGLPRDASGWAISGRSLAEGAGDGLDGDPDIGHRLCEMGLGFATWRLLDVAEGSRALVLMADAVYDRRAERNASDLDGPLREIALCLGSLLAARRERRRLNQLKALLDISRAVAETYDVSVLMEKTLTSINHSFGASLSHVLVFNEKEELKSVILEIGGRLEQLDVGMRDELISRSRQKGFQAMSHTLGEVSYARLLGSKSPLIGIPVRVEGRTLAVLKCKLAEYLSIDEIDTEFLKSLANQLAAGLKNIANHAQLQEMNSDLALLNRVAHNLNSMVSEGETLAYIGETCRELFNANTVFFGRMAEGFTTWERIAGTDAPEKIEGPGQTASMNGECVYLAGPELDRMGLAGAAVAARVGQDEETIGYLLVACSRDEDLELETASRILAPVAGYLYAALKRVGYYTLAFTEKAKLQAVFDAMPDAVMVVDGEGRFVTVNAQAERIFGLDGEAVAGMPVRDTLGLEELEDFVAAGDGPPDGEREMIVPVRPPRHTRAYLAGVSRPDGASLGKVAVLRDVTIEKQLENMKNEFLACVSHELNTPLTLVLASSETLCGNWDRMPEETKLELLGSIASGSARLNQLIKTILAITDEERGRSAGRMSRRDVGRLLAEAVETCRASDPEHRYVLELAGPCEARVDEARMKEALMCILDNARKFSGAGTTIRASVRSDGGEGRIEIADEGVGISPWHLGGIFEKFTQVDAGDTRRANGAGNGLYLAREIVRRHDGEIRVASEPGKGTRFEIVLPAGPGPSGKGLSDR